MFKCGLILVYVWLFWCNVLTDVILISVRSVWKHHLCEDCKWKKKKKVEETEADSSDLLDLFIRLLRPV